MFSMKRVAIVIFANLFLAPALAACSTSLLNEPDNTEFMKPSGIPWVEAREYDVYVYQFRSKNGSTDVKPLHYGRYVLSDKVNGKIIDPNRPKWTTNYRSAAFSDGSLKLTFHENGSLKEAQVTSQPGAAEGLQTITESLDVTNQIEKKELERLEREKKMKETREALEGGD
jgi:hypothetical protein